MYTPKRPSAAPRKIHVALGADDNLARGNIWTITAKKTDFYLDFHGTHNAGMHLSVHGPNEQFETHRFHVKIDRQSVQKARDEGSFVEHALGSNGYAFNGLKIAPHAYLVARIRWRWDLQRERFRTAALNLTGFPTFSPPDQGTYMKNKLLPNSAWDVDFVVSFEKPYWPDELRSLKNQSRLGPLTNKSGMWLTATSYHRSMLKYPTPDDLDFPVPLNGAQAQKFLSSGPGARGIDDLFWFVEGITQRGVLTATAASQGHNF